MDMATSGIPPSINTLELSAIKEHTRLPHEVLGIPRGSSTELVCWAFRRRALCARAEHPGGRATMHMICDAFHSMVRCAAGSPTSSEEVERPSRKRVLSMASSPQIQGKPTPSRSSSGSVMGPRRRATMTRQHALERLAGLLRSSDRDERRSALEELPATVRVALLSFMKQNKNAKMVQDVRLRARGRCSIERVMRTCGVRYRVAQCLPSLGIIMKSQYVASWEKALEICSAVTPAAATLSDSMFKGSEDRELRIDAQFREALATACLRTSLEVRDLRLSFAAQVWCPCVRFQVQGRYTRDLGEALRHVGQLSVAGRGDRGALKSLLICIRRLPTRRRLRCLNGYEASSRVDSAIHRLVRENIRRAGKAAERALHL